MQVIELKNERGKIRPANRRGFVTKKEEMGSSRETVVVNEPAQYGAGFDFSGENRNGLKFGIRIWNGFDPLMRPGLLKLSWAYQKLRPRLL